MSIKIDKKIVGYDVVKPSLGKESGHTHSQTLPLADAGEKRDNNNIVQMHERVARPDMLVGSTYKIKTPGIGACLLHHD